MKRKKICHLLALFQIILVFFLFFFLIAQSLFNQEFSHKSLLLLYRNVLGDNTLIKDSHTSDQRQQIHDNHVFFLSLSQKNQEILLKDYALLQKKTSKTKKIIATIFYSIPRFILIWLILAFILALLILKNKEGVKQASFLLPIILILYLTTLTPQHLGKASEKHAENNSPNFELIHKNVPSSLQERENFVKFRSQLFLILDHKKKDRRENNAPIQLKKRFVKLLFLWTCLVFLFL